MRYMRDLVMGPMLAAALLLCAPLLVRPQAAQGQPRSPHAAPDTARLHRALSEAIGDDFEIVRTEIGAATVERGGTYWLVHARPLRMAAYQLQYRYDLTRPHEPGHTRMEHTSYIRVGEPGCRRSLGREVCLGDVIILPFVADGAGHTFSLTRRAPSPALAREVRAPAPGAAAVANPAAAHLRYLENGSYEMLRRSGGGTRVHSAVFEAIAPGRFNLAVTSRLPGESALAPPAHGSIPVIVVPPGEPITVLLRNETVVSSDERGGFSSHTGSQYLTTPLLLQPGDRITLEYGRSPLPTGREDASTGAAPAPEPVISIFPFHLDTSQRFNAWVADHLPVVRDAGAR
jgi:hypothetical protein